jgi:hypothetical protein
VYKHKLSYYDYDDERREATLYFNINKVELTKNLHLKDRLEELEEMLKGDDETEERELTPDEIRQLVNFIEVLVDLAYGVRTEKDGEDRFFKSTAILEDFKASPMYSEFIYSLFAETPEQAVAFMYGVLPRELREQAAKATKIEDPGQRTEGKSKKKS